MCEDDPICRLSDDGEKSDAEKESVLEDVVPVHVDSDGRGGYRKKYGVVKEVFGGRVL